MSILHVGPASDPWHQEGCISLYLNREFYELNLSAFNEVFGFPNSVDLPHCHILQEFNLIQFGVKLRGTICMIPVIAKAQSLEIPKFEWPRGY